MNGLHSCITWKREKNEKKKNGDKIVSFDS